MEALALAKRIRGILDTKKAQNIEILDIRGHSMVTDYTVIASGMSEPHIKALFNDVLHELKQDGVACYRRNGEVDGGWVVLDYVDVVVHLLISETRTYYDLENIWGADVPHVA